MRAIVSPNLMTALFFGFFPIPSFGHRRHVRICDFFLSTVLNVKNKDRNKIVRNCRVTQFEGNTQRHEAAGC